MTLHGKVFEADSKRIRRDFDKEENCVRVLLLDDLYDRLKPLYDYLEAIAHGVSVTLTDAPDYIDACFEWFSTLVFEFGVQGIVFTVSVLAYVGKWVRDRVRLGKFTYGPQDYGSGIFGSGPYGGGAVVYELPVEG